MKPLSPEAQERLKAEVERFNREHPIERFSPSDAGGSVTPQAFIKPAYTTVRHDKGGIRKTLTPEGKRQAMEKLKCKRQELSI